MNKSVPWDADTDETRRLREQLVAALIQAGDITDESWKQPFLQVPRHALVPRYYRTENYQEVDGAAIENQAEWLHSVYSDETLITQKSERTVTSSGTMPGLIALMLRALDVRDRHQVLQIGTGTGYTAALLCARLGSGQVTTIDIDHRLVHSAGVRLRSLGYHPTTVAGNGACGYAPNAPYDRFLVTCALSRIPPGLLAQAAPSGRLVAPIVKGLIVLDIQDRQHAVGRFLPEGGYFMPLRLGIHDVHDESGVPSMPAGPSRHSALGPRDTFYQQHVRFLLAVALPEVLVGQHGPALDDLLIRDQAGSATRVEAAPDGRFLITETGPRRLWTEVEQLHRVWHDCGQPRRERFGLSVTPDRQWVWLDTPDDSRAWDLPE